MQANWSVGLNVLLLMIVIFIIVRMKMSRSKQTKAPIPVELKSPSIGQAVSGLGDDIIAVRKIMRDEVVIPEIGSVDDNNIIEPVEISHEEIATENQSGFEAKIVIDSFGASTHKPQLDSLDVKTSDLNSDCDNKTFMVFLLAKEKRQLAGYELLQTLLGSGLRFGEGNLFHRYQQINGHGPVMFSLAAATATGMFDLQNIGAFSAHGLCLYMHASGNSTIDTERLTMMLDTAKQLSEELDTYLLDERRKPLTETNLQEYYHRANKLQPDYRHEYA